MTCECIRLTNEALRDKNLMLDTAHWTNLQTGTTLTTVRIGTEKRMPKRGQRCPSFVPKFCPFCGVAYETASDSAARKPDAIIAGIMGDLCDMEQEDPGHHDALIVHYGTLAHVLERWITHGGVEPALAAASEGE